MEQYNHILMPFQDVYALGGPDVFTELARKKEGKNLIILPMEMVSQIMEPKKHMGQLGLGGLEALEEIVLSPSDPIEKNARIYHLSAGLDVAVFLEEETFNKFPLSDKLAEKIKEKWKNIDKIMTTNPTWRLRYEVKGFNVEKPKFLLVDSTVVEKGIVNGNNSLLQKLYENNGTVTLETAESLLKEEKDLYPNQFIRFTANNGHVYAIVTGDLVEVAGRVQEYVENPRVELIGRAGVLDMQIKVKNNSQRKEILGISPLDPEQYLAAQFGIFKPSTQIVFISGGASSGKTILGYVYAVEQILKNPDENSHERSRSFDQLVLLKPGNILGGDDRDPGYLPGTLWSKVSPHLEPFSDAHKESPVLMASLQFKEMFLHPRDKNEYGSKREHDKVNGSYLPENIEAIELTTSAYFRGRSLRRKLLVVDEAQNYTPYEIKTIIERLGEGSKAIILGDPNQFDNPRCSRDINGFTFAIKHFLPHPLTTLVKLTHSYRSEVSETARRLRVYSR